MVPLLLLTLLSSIPAAAIENGLLRFEFAQTHMGTSFRVLFYAEEENAAREAARTAFERIRDLDLMLSHYRPDSELMGLSQAPPAQWVRVSPELFFVLEEAQRYARLSEGAFDVTAGPLTRLWREGRRSRLPPDSESLERALESVGYRFLELDAVTGSVRLTRPGMELDLGGIAKGFAADEAARVLRGRGFHRFLVDAGGDLLLGDPPPGSAGWRVAVSTYDEAGEAHRVLELSRVAVATSGDRYRFLEVDGVRYSHLLDPRSGTPLRERTAVTVLAPDATAADALATLLGVVSDEEGKALVKRLEQVRARVVRVAREGVRSWESSRFPP